MTTEMSRRIARLPTDPVLAIVFDLDNTLVHSQIDFPRMRQRVLDIVRAHQVEIQSAATLESLATAEIISLAQRAAPPEATRAIWAEVTDEETLGMEHATVESDAISILQTLTRHGVRRVVLTNNARAAALTALERFGLMEHLDLVLARDDVPAMKPSPAGLVHARAKLKLGGRMAMVGDASIDGLAANRAGMPFVAFRPREDDMDRRGVHRWATIQQLEELEALLPRLRHAG